MMQQPDAYVGQNPAEVLARGFLPDFYQAAAAEERTQYGIYNTYRPDLSARLAASERILIGIGPEWGLKSEKRKSGIAGFPDPEQAEIKAAYEALYEMVKDKDYYLVTTLTDGAVYDTPFDRERITAPAGIFTGVSAAGPVQRISGRRENFQMSSAPLRRSSCGKYHKGRKLY